MASIANQYDPNDPNQSTNQGGGGQILNSTGGSGDAPSSGGGTSTTQSRAPLTGAPNVQQYLQANQGAGQQLQQGITQNVQSQANQIGQNVNQAQNQLNTQYQPLQQTESQGQNAANTAFQNPQALLDAYNSSKANQSTGTSAQPSADQQSNLNAYNQFQNVINPATQNQSIANYGTTGQQQFNNIQNQLSNLNQQTSSAVNPMGQFQLLQNTVGQPGYNQGQQTLDQLFLQSQPGVANQLKQNLGNISQNTTQSVNAANTDYQNKLAALQGLSSSNQQYAQNLFNQGLGQIGNNVNQEYQNAQTQGTQQATDLQKAIQTNKFTPDQLAALGLTQGEKTWGVDVGTAGQFAANPLTAANAGGLAQVASTDEFNRYNALNQLAGGANGAQPSIFGTSTTAGGYQPYTFDTNSLNAAIQAKQNAVTGTDFQSALSQVTPASWNGLESGVLNQIRSGNLSPDQANTLIQSYINNPNLASGYAYNTAQFAPFTNYYNNEYLPESTTEINANPNATPGAQPRQIVR